MKYDKINVESGINMYENILIAEESNEPDAKAKIHAKIYEGLYKGLEDKIMNKFLEAIKHQDKKMDHFDSKFDHFDAKFSNVQHSLDILLERRSLDMNNDAINIANKSKNWSKYATIAAAIGVALALGNILPSLHHFI